MSRGVLCGVHCRLAPVMKGENRLRMLLYLLVGALLLSTVLNFYFLLQLDARLADQELETQLLNLAPSPQQPVAQRGPAPPPTPYCPARPDGAIPAVSPALLLSSAHGHHCLIFGPAPPGAVADRPSAAARRGGPPGPIHGFAGLVAAGLTRSQSPVEWTADRSALVVMRHDRALLDRVARCHLLSLAPESGLATYPDGVDQELLVLLP